MTIKPALSISIAFSFDQIAEAGQEPVIPLLLSACPSFVKFRVISSLSARPILRPGAESRLGWASSRSSMC